MFRSFAAIMSTASARCSDPPSWMAWELFAPMLRRPGHDPNQQHLFGWLNGWFNGWLNQQELLGLVQLSMSAPWAGHLLVIPRVCTGYSTDRCRASRRVRHCAEAGVGEQPDELFLPSTRLPWGRRVMLLASCEQHLSSVVLWSSAKAVKFIWFI